MAKELTEYDKIEQGICDALGFRYSNIDDFKRDGTMKELVTPKGNKIVLFQSQWDRSIGRFGKELLGFMSNGKPVVIDLNSLMPTQRHDEKETMSFIDDETSMNTPMKY